MKRRIVIDIGEKIGSLTIVSEAPVMPSGHHAYLCLCECGVEKVIASARLRNGGTISCGCVRLKKIGQLVIKHGLCKHPLYKKWEGIKQRCFNPNHENYKHYGGRGITICERWLTFENFYNDLIGGYVPELTIERVENDGNYELSNIRWATKLEQQRNKRSNRFFYCNGMSKTITEFSEMTGVNAGTIASRIDSGWDIEDAIYLPARSKNKGFELIK